MKLSETTIEILKNFYTINSGMLVRPGKILKTYAENKAVLAEAVVDEEFDHEFATTDLGKLLSVLSLDRNADVTLKDEELVVSSMDNTAHVHIRYSAPNLIIAPPTKSLNIPHWNVKLALPESTFKWIADVVAILKCPHIVFQGKPGGDLFVQAIDTKGVVSDSAQIPVKGETDIEFEAAVKVENLRMIPGPYVVDIVSMGITRFTHQTKKLNYIVTCEKSASKFGEKSG